MGGNEDTTEGEREGDKDMHTNTDRETCTQGGRQREREERRTERGGGSKKKG